ncbi:hypothetical protein FXW07_07140 [Methanosarcina sp. DH1]|uniref:M12 family metallo-peptidase n=1 Tax=Methanosarcina sp. DH1 TaxID=2605695 RepID=UPI001E3B3063|nr:M12 family metallo-peptidase [Methanosarcina sp. DH1]MCC4766394.1 hypothetical protein [Methanosarcina sp. DH1]
MTIEKKYGIGVIFVTTLLVSILLLPVASATTENNQLDIINNINFDKKQLSDFNEELDSFETVTTNPAAFLNDVSDGQVTLELLGQKFDLLNLQEMHIVSDDAKIIAEDGSISNAPKSYSYKGTVADKTNSSVVLTAGDNVLIGEIKVDNKSYIIDQTNKTYNNKVVHVVYSSEAIKKRNILTYCTDIVTGDQKALSTGSLNQTQIEALLLSTPTVDVMACYDSEFQSKFSNPTNEISNMMSTVASAFSVGNCNLNIKAYRKYTISNGDSQTVLNRFTSAAAAGRDSTNSDLAFLFTGKELTDSNIGIANGYTGSSNQAYGLAQMVSAGASTSYHATSNERRAVTTHELGHMFGATHGEAYDWYVVAVHYYTSMLSPFKGSTMQSEFSNLNNHGNSTRNNILHIVANKGTISGFQ